MQRPKNNFNGLSRGRRNQSVDSFVTLLTIFAALFLGSFAALAQTTPPARQWESYMERPDITRVEAKSQDLDQNWKDLKPAHFSFVALLLEIYADHHIYFLARDAEYLYDIAKLATAGKPDAERIHLLNVSRGNMESKDLPGYLKDNGISEETLSAGKKVLFVDTGFAGTIPEEIRKLFSSSARQKLKTQLIQSTNPQIPESSTFLKYLDRSNSSIEVYEHMAHFTNRSNKYIQINGKFHAISPIATEIDGKVSREMSLRYMQDLKGDWAKPEVQRRFNYERSRARYLLGKVNSMESKPELRESLIQQVNAYLQRLPNAEKEMAESALIDIFRSAGNRGILYDRISPEDFGIDLRNQEVNQKSLMAARPEWKPYLQNLPWGIRYLVQNGKWEILEEMFAEVKGKEFKALILRHLFDGPAIGAKRRLQEQVFASVDIWTLKDLLAGNLNQVFGADFINQLSQMFESAAISKKRELLKVFIDVPGFVEANQDSVFRALRQSDSFLKINFLILSLTSPNAEAMKPFLKEVVEGGNSNEIKNLTHAIFPDGTKTPAVNPWESFFKPAVSIPRACSGVLQ